MSLANETSGKDFFVLPLIPPALRNRSEGSSPMTLRMVGHTQHPAWKDTDPLPDLTAELAYVAVADSDYRAQWEMDILPGYELTYVRDGTLLLWQGDHCLRATAGDVLVTPPRVPHREETPPDSFSTAIYLGAILRRGNGRKCLFPMPIEPLVHIGRGHLLEQRLLQILEEASSCAPGYMRIISGALIEIFWHLARISAGITVPRPGASVGLSFSSFRRDAEQYLAQHFAEPLSIDDIAAHFHLSRQYFSTLFRRVTGVPPHTYLIELRLRRAQELLALPDLSIHAVAANSGFTDPYYFSRCFRKHTGSSPSQYRRQIMALKTS